MIALHYIGKLYISIIQREIEVKKEEVNVSAMQTARNSTGTLNPRSVLPVQDCFLSFCQVVYCFNFGLVIPQLVFSWSKQIFLPSEICQNIKQKGGGIW